MDAAQVVQSLRDKGFLISPKALQILLESENPEELAEIAVKNASGKLVIEEEDLRKKEEPKVVVEYTDFKPYAKEIHGRVTIEENFEDGSHGTVEEFIDYFLDRYEKIKEMLINRGENHYVSIRDLKIKKDETVKIIGIVNDKYESSKGNLLIEIEDPTGKVTAIISKNNRSIYTKGEALVPDEVIALEGRMFKDFFIVNDILQPDIPIKDPKTIEQEIFLAAISDIHIGSKLFLKDIFEKFIKWLNGKIGTQKQREIAGRVKYITIAGDIVDGIGIYPNQEEELEITDIFGQYEAFEKYIEQIPEYIEIIISPGNHDAVRNADPQPPIPKELLPNIYNFSNLYMVSSPAMVNIHGFKTLIYHGTSFDDMIKYISHLDYENTEHVMEECLKRRHVHVIYGEKPITPYRYDHLVIRDVPDIFHSGHIHRNGYSIYRGVYCINSGTFQDITPYQLKQGHKPTPGIVPLLDMYQGKIRVIHFKSGEI